MRARAMISSHSSAESRSPKTTTRGCFSAISTLDRAVAGRAAAASPPKDALPGTASAGSLAGSLPPPLSCSR